MTRTIRAAAGLALAVVAACDIPSSAPEWEMTWNVPAADTTISVSKFLPTGGTNPVTVSPSGATFEYDANVTITRSLADFCPLCPSGVTVIKPAFTGTGSGTGTLPPGVTSLGLTGGSVTVTITNNFNFDPIRPSATAEGYIIIDILNGAGGTVPRLGRDSVPSRGPTGVALPPGSTITRTIALTGTASSTNPITVNVTLVSPAGDQITLQPTGTITFDVGTARVASATVSINQAIPGSTTELDLSEIDETITDRVRGAKVFLTVTNPFTLSGSMTLTFNGGTLGPITKSVTLDPATGTTPSSFTRSVELTQSEIQSLLGRNITITFAGNVTGTATATPAQVVAVATRMELTVSTKGTD